jgi:inhibitor of cysteine peptidase
VLRSLGPEVYSSPEDAGIVGSGGHLDLALPGPPPARATCAGLPAALGPEVRPVQTFDCAIRVN